MCQRSSLPLLSPSLSLGLPCTPPQPEFLFSFYESSERKREREGNSFVVCCSRRTAFSFSLLAQLICDQH